MPLQKLSSTDIADSEVHEINVLKMLVKSMREFEDVIIYEKYKDDVERE